MFAFLGRDGDTRPALAFNLPDSAGYALSLPGTEPTGRGLGKAGWVTVRLDAPAGPTQDVLLEWLDGSYRAIAPARLVTQLEHAGPS